jgi:hypothetical protein
VAVAALGRLLGNPHAAFYALVFTLVLWGLSPWRWSGFLNLNSLGFGLALVLAAGPAVAVLDLHQQPPRHVPGRPAADLPRPGALPLVLQRLRANRRDPLGLMLLGASAVYLWGWLSGNATYGRILSFVVLVLHIVLGAWFADLELRVRRGAARRPAAALAYGGIAVLLLVGLVGVSPGLLRTVPTQLLPGSHRSDARLAKVSDRYAFLGDCTGQYEVVLTDLGFPSLAEPTFGGKVVTTGYPIPFVGDKAARDAAVQRFFDPGTGTGERRAILARYRVAYLLVDGPELDAPERLGQVVAEHEHDGLTLIATGPSRCRAPGRPS